MITNQEIVDTYLAYKHRRRTKGERIDNTLPLMPFFIMDARYQIYCKDIKNLPLKHLMKKHRNKWADNYHKFTTDFFAAFNQEQTDYIVDMMDEFNDYIHNTIVMLKSEVVNYIGQDIPFETKKTLGSLLACNVLSQAAQHMYGAMYCKRDLRKEIDPYIEAIKKASYDISSCYVLTDDIDLTNSTKVMDVVGLLCNKIVQFLKEKENIGKS